MAIYAGSLLSCLKDVESKGVYQDIVRATSLISLFARPESWPVTPALRNDQADGPGGGGGVDSGAALAGRVEAWSTFAGRKWEDLVPNDQLGRAALLVVLEIFLPNPFCIDDLYYAAESCMQERCSTEVKAKAAALVSFGADIDVSAAASGNAFALARQRRPQ